MPLRCAITKVSGQGEQLVVDVCQWNPVTGEILHKDISEMSELMEKALKFSDDRMYEMNMRMLEAYDFKEYFDPGVWQQVVALFDIISGRQDARLVKQRWDSVIEENQALQNGREAYAASCE